MTNDQHNFVGTLDKYVGGQCISCPYAGTPTRVGNDGTIIINFTSETSATLTLPGGRTTQIQSLNFATGDPPAGLLGEWVFVYDVGATTVANRVDFSTTQTSATPNFGDFAVDPGRNVGCALGLSGASQGVVICAVLDPVGHLLYGYAFHFGLDQTYDGFWVSADGATSYPMKGFKVRARSGFVNKLGTVVGAMPDAADPGMRREALGSASAQQSAWEAGVQSLSEAVGRVPRAP